MLGKTLGRAGRAMRKGVSTLRPASSHALQGTAAHAGKCCNCRPPPPWPQLHTQHTLPARQPTHVAYSSCVAAPPMRARTAMLLPWNSGRRRRLGTTPTRQSVGTGGRQQLDKCSAGAARAGGGAASSVAAACSLVTRPAQSAPPHLIHPTSSTHPPTHCLTVHGPNAAAPRKAQAHEPEDGQHRHRDVGLQNNGHHCSRWQGECGEVWLAF